MFPSVSGLTQQRFFYKVKILHDDEISLFFSHTEPIVGCFLPIAFPLIGLIGINLCLAQSFAPQGTHQSRVNSILNPQSIQYHFFVGQIPTFAVHFASIWPFKINWWEDISGWLLSIYKAEEISLGVTFMPFPTPPKFSSDELLSFHQSFSCNSFFSSLNWTNFTINYFGNFKKLSFDLKLIPNFKD